MMPELAGLLTTLWLVGLLLYLWGGAAVPRLRPYGWPWLVPLWPLFLGFEALHRVMERRRLQRLKRDVWQR
jgi:hypothetical protein